MVNGLPYTTGFGENPGVVEGLAVLKVWSALRFVPALLVATSWKWYLVPDFKPLIDADTGMGVVPAPIA
jgi:hypothetical protein